ncbi:MFS transporter [Catenovulum sp. SX2]|uniref:MFS transporter n=1 Tax=Catenovulum sp. SX2 TaxID=3398614 RepID=UPI003F83CD68
MKERKIGFLNYTAYGLGDVLGAGSMAVISAWVLFFYTTYCDLSPIQAGIIFAAARILDAVASPLIGYLSDNADSTKLGRRFGRRKIFLLIAIPLLPSFALMWVSGQHFFYYLFTYIFFELVYASVLIPYETLAAEMTKDFRKKGMFAGARILVGHLSAIAATILPAWIVAVLGGKDSPDTFLIMGGIFSVAFMLVVTIVYLFTWEREKSPEELAQAAQQTTSLGEVFSKLYKGLGFTLKIRAFRLHLGMYLGGYISQDIFNAAFTYFAAFALGSIFAYSASESLSLTSYLMASIFTVQTIAVGAVFACVALLPKFFPALTYRFAVVAYIIGIAGLASFYYMTPDSQGGQISWMVLALIFAGIGRGILNYIPWNTYNYMADVDQIVTGLRREGSFAGVMTFVRKAAQASAVFAVGAALEVGGLVKGERVQSTEVMESIVNIMTIGPIIVLIFGYWVSTKFKLNTDTHTILMDEIERFKQGHREPSSAENKAIIEDLTGWKYEQLWGNNVVGQSAASDVAAASTAKKCAGEA